MKSFYLILVATILLSTSIYAEKNIKQVPSASDTLQSVSKANALKEITGPQSDKQSLVEEEFDYTEVAALIIIRDNAPTDSPLKTKWANEANIGTWEGVVWTSTPIKKVIKLYLYNNKLTTLDLSPFSLLEIAYCNENNLVLLKCEGLTKLKELHCGQNKLSFANLPLVSSLVNVWYSYGGQYKLYEERAISTGETIDYSFDAQLINGKPTVFTWFKDNVKIEGTDQSGKYTPTTDGYYYCVMTNAEFPQLTLTTNAVKAGTAAEYDPRDIEALKAIRDNAPANSPLKTEWADETKVGTWNGVTWTDLKTKRVKALALHWRKLINLDVTSLPFLEELNCAQNDLLSLNITGLKNLKTLNCAYNKLTSVDLTGVPLLEYMYCSNNSIPFSKLPIRLPVNNRACDWNPQNSVFEERTISLGDEIDFSSEATINGRPSTFYWYAFGVLIKTEQTGKFTPKEEGYYHCMIASSYFTGFVETTKLIKVGNPPEYDIQEINALKAIRDNAPAESPLKTLWADDSKVATWKGVTWSQSLSKKVIYLDLSFQKLISIDVSQLRYLLILDCEYNNLTSINVGGLDYLERLTCSNNNLKFSTLPLHPSIKISSYWPQNMLDRERSINTGETIDYSSEAVIDGVSTVFTWYRNNTKIENADQSGKHTPTEDGFYYCVLTNSKFPSLTLTSNSVNVGVSPDYDPKDVEALRNIRDKAPNDSPLKTEWADETKFSTWPGVIWESSVKPKKVTSLNVYNKKLTELDVSQLWLLTELYCGENSLTKLDLTKLTELQKLNCWYNKISQLNIPEFPKLYHLDCSSNRLSFSKLPLNVDHRNYFRYYSQAPYDEEKTINLGETIDFSSEATIGGIETVFTWYRNNEKISGTDKSGKYTPTQEGIYYCAMSNSKFPLITIKSGLFKIGLTETYFLQDVNAIKAIRDNAPEDSPIKTLWADDSKIGSWSGISWSSGLPYRIISLLLNNQKLTSLDLRPLEALEYVECNHNSLQTLNITGLNKLKKIDCSYNQLSSLDITGATAIYGIYCQYNKIPLSKLPHRTKSSITLSFYNYANQNPYDNQKTIASGETIDFSSEANIEGISTKFSWYIGGIMIYNADQSGKYTPTEDGYYTCTMTNEIYPELTITTGQFKLGEPAEYSMQDKNALIAIRDNAPSDSPLKTLWADESAFTLWQGVSWSGIATKRVIGLYISNKSLSNLDVSQLIYLKILDCSSNNILSLNTKGTSLNSLNCTQNKLAFSKLLLPDDRTNTSLTLYYHPQKLLFEEKSIMQGETIDYSSEAFIDGKPTVFTWYRNGVKQTNTDQSGRFSPIEEGYYFCTFSNLKFPGVLLTSNNIRVGNPPEFDSQDIAALIAIRDNAPTNSILKTRWADDSKFGTWSGVTWNNNQSKKVIRLSVPFAELTTLDVSKLASLQYLDCSYNKLTKLNVFGLSKLTELNCGYNSLMFSSLPVNLASTYSYIYHPQSPAQESKKIQLGETIDFSSEVLFDGVSTVYTWYKNNTKIETANQTGKYVPITEGFYHCTMTNAKFPKLTLTSNIFQVGNPPEYDPQDIISLKKLRDNSNSSSPLKIWWADDNDPKSWKGITWSINFPRKVTQLSISECNIITLQGITLPELERMDCVNNPIESLDLSIFPKLKFVNCSRCILKSLKIDGLQFLTELNCSQNLLTFTTLPLKLIPYNSSYYYSPQLWINDMKLYNVGSVIDYSSETKIDGASTTYSWYRNGILITGTDNSGKFTVPSYGFYYCKMKNPKFSNLEIITTEINVGNGDEYDIDEVNQLKSIRDKAPADSPLKTIWAGSDIKTWQNISWSTFKPKKVISLRLSSMKLKELTLNSFLNLENLECHNNSLTVLELSALPNLKSVICSGNLLTSLNIAGLTKLSSLECSSNRIPFSGLPLNIFSSNTTFMYSSQKPFDETRQISVGEAIDFSSEASIDGTNTIFTWYRNNIKVEGTDNSGKYTPTSEGTYYCVMTNLRFPKLTITTGKTIVGDFQEYDERDVAALKAIRDNAPSSSALKTIWSDDKPISSWINITWSGIYPQRVKELFLIRMELSAIDISKFPELEFLDCCYNQIEEINVLGNPNIKRLYCFQNKIPFSKLPQTNLFASDKYYYSPQNKLYSYRSITAGETIDYSRESIINGFATTFTWYKNGTVIGGTDQSGKYQPTEEGFYSCQMTNPNFPKLTLTTTEVKVGSPDEFFAEDIIALKTIRDNAPESSPLKALWADDSMVNSWEGVNWSTTYPKRVYTLRVSKQELINLSSVNNLTALTTLQCDNNNIKKLDLSGLKYLLRLFCSHNQLTFIDLAGVEKLEYISCDNNNFSLSSLPLQPYNIPYYYAYPQNPAFEEQWLDVGQTIDFSSETPIRTFNTIFYWYKDNIMDAIEVNTTGKYTPASPGVYYCTMSNFVFSSVSVTSSKIYVGGNKGYNVQDLEGLKAIRNQAPADSPIKTVWADEISPEQWPGVKWNNSNPKMVMELSVNNMKLDQLDVTPFKFLERLECQNNNITKLLLKDFGLLNYINCSYNKIETLNIYNSIQIKHLYCQYNKIPFSSLPTRLPVSGGTYQYSPMNLLFEERSLPVGESINLILESLIENSGTSFIWYRNNILINETDNSGKLQPNEPGDYSCAMTNAKFPGLIQKINTVHFIEINGYDPGDIQALKSIRDKAPDGSPLKSLWANNSQFSSWKGVEWSAASPKKVKTLQLSQMGLSQLDVSELSNIEQLYCSNNRLVSINLSGLINLNYLSISYNQLESININGLTKLTNLFCNNNKFSFSQLPPKVPVKGGNYQYWPQLSVFDEKTILIGETISFASEAVIDGTQTIYTWYYNETKIEGLSNVSEYKPSKKGVYYCKMTNSKFPGLTLETGKITVVDILENKAPVSNAGNTVSVAAGTIVSLNGSKSSDPEGGNLTFLWEAPEGITLSSNTAVSPVFIAPLVKKDTTFTFTLIVNDGQFNSAPSQISVNIKQLPSQLKVFAKLNGSYLLANKVIYKLYKKVGDKFEPAFPLFSSADTTTEFIIDAGEWLVLATPATSSDIFIPTYFGNTLDVSEAQKILITETTSLSKEIEVFPTIIEEKGEGKISGYVNEIIDETQKGAYITLAKTETFNPVDGVLIHLYEKGKSSPTASVFTDLQGFYKFENLKIAEYEIEVVIPGVTTSDKFPIAISESEPEATLRFAVSLNSGLITHSKAEALQNIKIYPNPVSRFLNVDLGTSFTSIKELLIFDQTGQLLKTQIVDRQNVTSDFSSFSPGIYVLAIRSSVGTKSILVQKK